MQLEHPGQRRPGVLLNLGGADSGSRARHVRPRSAIVSQPQDNIRKETSGVRQPLSRAPCLDVCAAGKPAPGRDRWINGQRGLEPVFRGPHDQNIQHTMKIILQKLRSLLHRDTATSRVLWLQTEFSFSTRRQS